MFRRSKAEGNRVTIQSVVREQGLWYRLQFWWLVRKYQKRDRKRVKAPKPNKYSKDATKAKVRLNSIYA